ncbi:MAG TPA: M13-type metalloendopeptidase [Acidimicrobiales bacterium]|nr:M13-type metalloendopeptidase [Acidimicrobiales bacterium]
MFAVHGTISSHHVDHHRSQRVTTTDPPRSHDFDVTIRPQDDLFGHVNGTWAATVSIPEDRSVHGSFEILRDEAEANVRAIIEEAAASEAPRGTELQQIGDLYTSFMDEAAVEAAGAAPLRPLFERVAAIHDREALVQLLGELLRLGVGGPLSMHVGVDKGNPSRNVLHLFQSGLGLPDESYYRLDEHEALRVAYRSSMIGLMDLAGIGGGEEADAVIGLETRLADAHWDRTAVRDAVKTYNLRSADELEALLPVAPRLFTAGGITEQAWAEVVVAQPDVVEATSRLLEEVDLDSWKHWSSWRVLASQAPYLSSAFVEAHFDFYGRTLTGAPQLRERWKRGVGLVQAVLGEAVGKRYVERHYPPKAEAQMAQLVENLLEAYRRRITDLEWMADETRQRALAKLAAFTPKIGKPVKWRDYSSLEVDPHDLIGNIRRADAFAFEYQLGKLEGPVDRNEWHMTPQTVNAYYNPPMNEIVFPAAILQPPFFDPDVDPAYNYGAIGAVIGHEIGHGFDDQGSRYDGDGTLRDWWTPEDRARFDVKVKALIEQYDCLSPRGLDPRHTVNGGLTVGENIGDLGGVTVAHHAYRLSLGASGEDAPVIDGLTGDQRFFIGWALVWRVVLREAYAIQRLSLGPHSPPEFRANAVRNVDAFHDAFGTAPGDGLWLDPELRVSIW